MIRAAAGEKITDESWEVRGKWQITNVRRRWHGGNYGLATIPKQLKASGVKANMMRYGG